MAREETPLSPLTALMAAYGGREAEWHRLVWQLDARLADVVRTTTEAIIGQMRLTWWHDVLTDPAGAKGKGDPLVNRLRAEGGLTDADRLSGLVAMIDGWERLLEPMPLDEETVAAFGRERGGGLFRALGGKAGDVMPADWAEGAGSVWALWDLSGHIGDAATARLALEVASARLAGIDGAQARMVPKAQRLAFALARGDVRRMRGAPVHLTPGLYLRLLRAATIGR